MNSNLRKRQRLIVLATFAMTLGLAGCASAADGADVIGGGGAGATTATGPQQEVVRERPPSLSNTPFDITDATIDLTRATDFATDEFFHLTTRQLAENEYLQPTISRVVMSTNARGELEYVFNIFDPEDMQAGLARITINSLSGAAAIDANRQAITDPRGPTFLDLSREVITSAEAQGTAIDRVGGGDVTRITFRANRAGRMRYDIVITNADGRYLVSVDAISGGVTNVEELERTTEYEADEYYDDIDGFYDDVDDE